jgi:S1-C subfamily serine protease
VAVVLMVPQTALAQSAPPSQDLPVAMPTEFEKVVSFVQPSIAYLDIVWTGWVYDTTNKGYLNNAKPYVLQSSCTGFFVNPNGYIATAGHCIDKVNIAPDFLDAAAAWAYECRCYYADKTLTFETIRGFADDYRIEGESKGAGGKSYTRGGDVKIQVVWSTSSTEPLYDSEGDLSGEPHPARIVRSLPWNDGAGDVGILKIEGFNDLPSLPIASSEAIDTGTEVVSIGYPASVTGVSDAVLSDPSFKEGSVSSVRTNGEFPVYELSSALSGGMSGGPTVNLAGEVVGVNSYSIVGEASEFNFVQASSTLTEVMGDASVTNEMGESGTAYRAGLAALWSGNKAGALTLLEDAADAYDDFEMAEEFIDQAEELPDAAPAATEEEGGGISPLILIGTIVVLGGIGLFLWMFFNRKKGTPQPGREPAVISTHDQATEKIPATQIAGPDETTGFCTNCGAGIDNDAAFCRKCGTRVKTTA